VTKVLGASIGNDVHTGGIVNFLHLAEECGYIARFLGPAVPVERLVAEIRNEMPDLVAISYRLTPENARAVLGQLRAEVERRGGCGTAASSSEEPHPVRASPRRPACSTPSSMEASRSR
jgi:hypothetical protein